MLDECGKTNNLLVFGSIGISYLKKGNRHRVQEELRWYIHIDIAIYVVSIKLVGLVIGLLLLCLTTAHTV